MKKLPMIILYVSDQEASKSFYEKVLGITPRLHVKGMTEFQYGNHFVIGLMPENGIANILTPHTAHPATGNGIPRCELYLFVANANESLQQAVMAGAKLISSSMKRDWGDEVSYCADPDGHVLAFATQK